MRIRSLFTKTGFLGNLGAEKIHLRSQISSFISLFVFYIM